MIPDCFSLETPALPHRFFSTNPSMDLIQSLRYVVFTHDLLLKLIETTYRQCCKKIVYLATTAMASILEQHIGS